jgi:PIN domain nuclease of toxin-antitoxin system
VAALTYLDTHVAAWLYAGRIDLFSRRAANAIEEAELLISPMVALELQYLRETGRIAVGANTIVRALQAQIGLRVCDLVFPTVVGSALEQSWTRDPFDRIIVGHAAAAGRSLISKDRSIRRHYRRTVW